MFQPTKGQPFTCVFSFFLSFHSNGRIESEERFVEIAAIWEETMKISDIPVEVKDVGLCFGCLSNSWFLGYPATLIYRIIESEVGDICDEGRFVCLHVSYHLHVWFTRNKKNHWQICRGSWNEFHLDLRQGCTGADSDRHVLLFVDPKKHIGE